MAVVVEPVLTEEKLRSLLAEGHEQPALDYKTQLDLRERRDVVELAKDVAAMQSEEAGGYIVIGADDHGKVTPSVTDEQAKLFDEATLRNKLKRYLAEPFETRTAIHKVEDCTVVLVYIAPNPEGWCIFQANGEYEHEDPPDSGKMKKEIVFRVGDVFVRHGTASERWQDTDKKRLIERVTAQKKEGWRAELRAELANMNNPGLSAQQIEQMPSSIVTWQLDAEGFDELVTELMRHNDDIPLRKVMMRARVDASSLLSSDLEELSTLLNRITSLAALALTYERQRWFIKALDALVHIYELGFDASGYQRADVPAVKLWLYVIARIYALGGLAVRLQNWDAVRLLADRSPNSQEFDYYGSWLRHALTEAARAQVLEDKENAGLIARAHNVVRAVDALHPDLDPEAEDVLNSLCQFDALGALVVIGEKKDTDDRNFYTNFARYYSRRTEPVLAAIVTDKDMRKRLFDGDDSLLSAAIKELNRLASSEGFSYSGWTGIRNNTVLGFLKANVE